MFSMRCARCARCSRIFLSHCLYRVKFVNEVKAEEMKAEVHKRVRWCRRGRIGKNLAHLAQLAQPAGRPDHRAGEPTGGERVKSIGILRVWATGHPCAIGRASATETTRAHSADRLAADFGCQDINPICTDGKS